MHALCSFSCLFQLQILIRLTLYGKNFVNVIDFGAMGGPMNVLDVNFILTKNLHFAVPKALQDLSVSNLFDIELEKNCYVLLSQSDSITPWHVDFYKLVHGRKMFLVIPGTVRKQKNSQELVH